MARTHPRGYRGSFDPESVDVDTVFRLLSHTECRHILRKLASHPGNFVPVGELVDSCVEAQPDDRDIDREAVEIQCHHQHLPALEAAGLIEYDETSGDVRYYRNPMVEEVLDIVHQWKE